MGNEISFIFDIIDMVMENIDIEKNDFEIPSEVLDEIQQNIQDIINGFDIPDDNKMDVIKKINFMYTQTKQLSETDSLTRLYNRRHFEMDLDREFKRAKRYKNPLSLAIIDIDYFKNFNDNYGHLCGDYVLREIAYIIVNNFRQTDSVARYGGEEFAVILTETGEEASYIPLERLREKIENSQFKYNGQTFKVTVSIGVTSKVDSETSWEMFEEADRALYVAKKDGRNRVVSFVR